MSWIHLKDLVRMFWHAASNGEVHGAYNAVSPQVPDNREFTRIMAASFGKKVWAPPVPAFGLKLVMGKMASVALNSIGADSSRIQRSGFSFDFPGLEEAMADLASS